MVDPTRSTDVAVVTHAHADHARPVSRVVHCAEEGADLRQRVGADAELVTHRYGAPFRLGDVEVSLHPAGHIRGSAQVSVTRGDERWVVSGDYKRELDPTCAPFEVVPCDVFITEATFALPIYRWQPTSQVMEEIWTWWQRQAAAGRCAMLFCYALGKAQRILAGLTRHTDLPVYVHGAMRPLTEAYRAEGVHMLETRDATVKARDDGFRGQLVLAPPSASRTTWMDGSRMCRPPSPPDGCGCAASVGGAGGTTALSSRTTWTGRASWRPSRPPARDGCW